VQAAEAVKMQWFYNPFHGGTLSGYSIEDMEQIVNTAKSGILSLEADIKERKAMVNEKKTCKCGICESDGVITGNPCPNQACKTDICTACIGRMRASRDAYCKSCPFCRTPRV
jgi:hypothetical protein